MRTGIAAFSGGVILLYWIGEILPAWVFISVIVIALMGLRQGWRIRRISVVTLCLAAGLGWATGMATLRLDARLPATLETEQLTVLGYRCSLPAPGAYNSVRFDFCVTQWPDKSPQLAPVRKLKLAIYGDEASLAMPQRLELSVRLKRPHGAYNPAGFDYESWLFREGYHATGSVQHWQSAPSLTCSVRCRYHQWREQLADALQAQFGTLTHYALVESLLLGERRFLEAPDWDLFRATGTSHLIAISGLHIGLIGTMVGLLVRLLLYWVPPHWLTQPQRRLATVSIGLMGCGVYALMAGLSVPTQRALVMATVAGVVYLRGRLSGYWTAWLAAWALVLAIDPFAPLDMGLWLSFVAVACLILAFSGRTRPPGKIGAIVSAQFAISAGMLPVLAVMRQAPAALGWLANIIAIPWLSFVIMPVLFLGAIGLALGAPGIEGLSWSMDASLGLMVAGLQRVAELTPQVQPLPVVLAACVGLLLFALLFAAHWRMRLLLGSAVVAILFGLNGVNATDAGNARVESHELWVWDVGQGLSVLFRTGDKTVLYDTGPGSPSGYSAVESVILPNFQALGVRSLSLLVISHGDADHASGLSRLLTTVPAGQIVSGEPKRLDFRPLERDKRSAVRPCQNMTPVLLGEARVDFWQAPIRYRDEGNDASCVVRIRLPGAEIILPGDSSKAIENLWLESTAMEPGRTRIVLASHHGSQTSSGQAWVKALSPAYVVFSAGYRHPYGHPAETVTARFENAGSTAFNTALAGAIHFRIESGAVTARAERQNAPFWVEPFLTGKR